MLGFEDSTQPTQLSSFCDIEIMRRKLGRERNHKFEKLCAKNNKNVGFRRLNPTYSTKKIIPEISQAYIKDNHVF